MSSIGDRAYVLAEHDTGEALRSIASGGLLVLIFTIPWENVVEIASLGTLSRVVGLGVGAVWILAVIASDRVRAPSPVVAAAFLFVVWGVVTLFWTVDVDATVARSITYMQLMLLVYLVWDLVLDQKRFSRSVGAYLLGSWVTLGALFYHAASFGLAGWDARFTIGTFQADDLGLIIALCIPIAAYVAVNETRRFRPVMRILGAVYVPAAVVGILLSGSRAALAAALPGIIYAAICWVRRAAGWRLITLGVLLVAVVVIAPLIPVVTLQRVTTAGNDPIEGFLNGREIVWREAYATFQAHPVTGVGSGAFRAQDAGRVARNSGGKVAHNFTLQLWAELGIIGWAIFMTMLALLVLSIARLPRWRRGLWMSTLLTWIIGASFYNFQDRKQTWVLFALAMAAGSLLDPSPGSEGVD
jgi:O-antigen ligase